MNDTKKYYWIKLKTNFFNREDIDFMLSQENGCQYVVLYQMLCLNTANNNGRLETKMNEVIIPYDIKKIVRDCKYFDYDTVAVALDLYRKLGLIYEEENKILKISNYDEMIGSETKWAEQKRIYRENKKLLENKQDNVVDNVRQEYRDKSIENRDIDNKSIEIIKKENKKEKNKYSEYVYMTEEEYNKLINKYGEYFTKLCIEKLDNYKGSNGKKYKDDYRAILNWVVDEVKSKEKTLTNSEKQNRILEALANGEITIN